MKSILLFIAFCFAVVATAQTVPTRSTLNQLHPFWEFLEEQRLTLEQNTNQTYHSKLEFSDPMVYLEMQDSTNQLFFRVAYEFNSSAEVSLAGTYCIDPTLEEDLSTNANIFLETTSWEGEPENVFPLGQEQLNSFKIADRIALADDHHGVRETIILTSERIHIVRNNHWNAKSLDHKDSYYLTNLEFIIPLTTENMEISGLGISIGAMEVIFYNGSAISQKGYADNITARIHYEKEKYEANLHITIPTLQSLLEASEVIHQETFKLKFLLRVLPDNGWFLQLNKDGRYEYIHWCGLSDNSGTILEQGSYTIENNQILLKADVGESEFDNYTFYLVTTNDKDIRDNIIVYCDAYKDSTYCLYKVVE